MDMKSLKSFFLNRKPAFGTWMSLGHPSVAEMFALSGACFLGIDLEHSTISQEEAQRIIAASQAAGVSCLPRVTSHNGAQIKQLLDSGADGIIVPDVRNLKEVEQIVGWFKYPPLGTRSFGVARAQGYGFDFDAYVANWNACSTLIVQIESVEGVEAVDSIVSHAEVDGIMIGPYDISGSLGIPGQLDHPRVREACTHVIQSCEKHQKGCGTQVIEPSVQKVRSVFEEGYTFVVLASDVFVLWKWSERMQVLTSSFKTVNKKGVTQCT